MARKSRKNLPQPEQATVSVQFPELDEEKIPTAIYGRLSVEDDEDNESMETQIALVQDFINRSSELNYVDTYFDNGFTGTNFKRPAFTRLMNDVRQKKIKCIVVKDLSRFGRNYLEAGYYIETVFPFLGVRLIAVTDNFDSTRKEDMESLALPIRNMVNTMYAKDISKKVWTSLQRKKEAGYAVGSDAPFGYIRNPVTKRNEIDPETAFYGQQTNRKEDEMSMTRKLVKLILTLLTLPLLVVVWLLKWFVTFLHCCSAWIFYLLGSVLLATAVLSFLMKQSQGIEALQMLIGGFVIFMIPQVVGSVVVFLELAAAIIRQVWYI